MSKYPITDQEDVEAAREVLRTMARYSRTTDHGRYVARELGRAATAATTSRRDGTGTSVPVHDYRQSELDRQDHAVMDAVPEKLTGWATSPLPKPVRWHAEWIAARQKYVRSGDPGDLDAMRAFVTFDSPPLLADVEAVRGAPRRLSLVTVALALFTLLAAAVLTLGWVVDPSPAGVPVTAGWSLVFVALWRVHASHERKRRAR